MHYNYCQDYLPQLSYSQCPNCLIYHIYKHDFYHPLALLLGLLPYSPQRLTILFTITRLYHSLALLLSFYTTSTNKTIYHPLVLLLFLRMYVPHLRTRLFTIYWLCYCPYRRMYHIYSQDHLPSTGSATVLTNVCTTSTHKTIYHLLALLLSLQTYVPHLLTRPFTIYWACDCPYGRMYHIYSQDHLPSTGSVTVLMDV